jgi:hypothetical protein
MTQAMYFVQGPKEVVMILASKQEIRHVYLTDKHSPNVKTSWYGESIGHYDDDALVVDTIGLDDRTLVDGFGTPHTKQIHVTERFHLIEDGKVLEATFTSRTRVPLRCPGTPSSASANMRRQCTRCRSNALHN